MTAKPQDKKRVVLGILVFHLPSKDSLCIDETGSLWGDTDKVGVAGEAILYKLPLGNLILLVLLRPLRSASNKIVTWIFRLNGPGATGDTRVGIFYAQGRVHFGSGVSCYMNGLPLKANKFHKLNNLESSINLNGERHCRWVNLIATKSIPKKYREVATQTRSSPPNLMESAIGIYQSYYSVFVKMAESIGRNFMDISHHVSWWLACWFIVVYQLVN